MKILLVAERYWPEVGAAPSRLANMAEGLKNKGCEVEVLTSLPNYPKGRIFDGYRGCISKKEVHGGVDLFRYWIYATVSRSPLARIINMFSFAIMIWLFAFKRKRVKSYDAVIIQTPTLIVGASAMMLFKGLYGKKCIINVSDIWPLTAVDMGAMKEGSRSFRFMQWCEHYMYRRCDGVLGQSEEILNHVAQDRVLLSSNGSKGAPSTGSGAGSKVAEEYARLSALGSGQKDTDEILNSRLWTLDPRLFLYRNLQTYNLEYDHKTRGDVFKVVFSGMLGVAQDVAGIVKNVPFKEMGVEFHIIGGGKQLEEIETWCKEHPDSKVYTHGFVPKEQIAERLRWRDASIVPLATRIRGAVPSKLYDILPQGLPILFCGGGEGAHFIEERNVGLTSAPGDYKALEENIKRLRDLSTSDYEAMSGRCIQVSKDELNFDKQMTEVVEWLKSIC